jgi:hypothetical protein
MRLRHGQVLETLHRTQGFLDDKKPLFDEVNASMARTNLDDVVVQIEGFSVTQEGSDRSSRGETAKQRSLKASLRFNYMRPVAVVARQQLKDVPEFGALQMPRGNLTAMQLVAVAGGMADAADAHAAELTDGGLPHDFLPKLRDAASELSQSVDDRNTHRRVRAGSTAALEELESRGRSILKLLDSLLTPLLGSDANLLAEWRSVRRIPRKTGPLASSPA